MKCTGKQCIMQYDKVDPATYQCVSYCPQATPPKTHADRIRAMTDEEIENWFWWMHEEMMRYTDSRVFLHNWLKQEASK